MATKLQNSPSKLKVYGYIRVSTEEQVSQGLSLNVQIDKIQTYAQSKNFELVEILKDKLSGKNLQRPGLQELIRMAKKEKECAIVVYKLDRLTRNTGDLLNLIDNFFRAEKISLFSVSEEVDVNSPMGRFTLTVMGAIAQMEREVLSERVSSALQYKKQQGHSLGFVPYGFQRIDGMLSKQFEEQNILRRIKRWRKEGFGYKRIADRLNEKEIKPRRKKAKWHASTIHHILKRTS